MAKPEPDVERAVELRTRAESLSQESAEPPRGLSPAETQFVLHELRVHQIELQMQNDELRRAQAALESARARYFDLYELAPMGYCTLDEKGLIVEANLTAAKLLCTTRSALLQKPFIAFIDREWQDIFYQRRKQLWAKSMSQAFELRMVTAPGTFLWVWLEATHAKNSEGKAECRIAINDITAFKEAESDSRGSTSALEQRIAECTAELLGMQANLRREIGLRGLSQERLLQSQAQLRMLADSSVDAILTIDPIGLIESVNQSAERIFGWHTGELIGRHIEFLLPTSGGDEHGTLPGQHLTSDAPRGIGSGREVVGRHRDGSTLALRLRIHDVVVEGAPKFMAILGDSSRRERPQD